MLEALFIVTSTKSLVCWTCAFFMSQSQMVARRRVNWSGNWHNKYTQSLSLKPKEIITKILKHFKVRDVYNVSGTLSCHALVQDTTCTPVNISGAPSWEGRETFSSAWCEHWQRWHYCYYQSKQNLKSLIQSTYSFVISFTDFAF